MRQQPFYEVLSTTLGTIGIVWWQAATGARVRRVLLREGQEPIEDVIRENYPHAHLSSSPAILELSSQIQRFMEGEAVIFSLEMLALEVCNEFQQQVLQSTYEIPRGWVSTYGRMAKNIGMGGSRTVGQALAANPFPIIIPCHRIVRAGGEIGGYQGGHRMKHALLALEGVEFTLKDRVLMQRVYHAPR